MHNCFIKFFLIGAVFTFNSLDVFARERERDINLSYFDNAGGNCAKTFLSLYDQITFQKPEQKTLWPTESANKFTEFFSDLESEGSAALRHFSRDEAFFAVAKKHGFILENDTLGYSPEHNKLSHFLRHNLGGTSLNQIADAVLVNDYLVAPYTDGRDFLFRRGTQLDHEHVRTLVATYGDFNRRIRENIKAEELHAFQTQMSQYVSIIFNEAFRVLDAMDSYNLDRYVGRVSPTNFPNADERAILRQSCFASRIAEGRIRYFMNQVPHPVAEFALEDEDLWSSQIRFDYRDQLEAIAERTQGFLDLPYNDPLN